MNVECPQCGMESAYHNGVCYECPDCDYEWSDGIDLFDSLEDDDEELPEGDPKGAIAHIKNGNIIGAISLLKTIYQELGPKDFNYWFYENMFELFRPNNGGFLALVLEGVLRFDKKLGELALPNNDIYRLCVLSGSWDLYECYREEFLDKYLSSLTQRESNNLKSELFKLAHNLFELRLDKYEPLMIGVDFNTGVRTEDGMIKSYEEDFNTILTATANYNGIVGRWRIIKDLGRRIEG